MKRNRIGLLAALGVLLTASGVFAQRGPAGVQGMNGNGPYGGRGPGNSATVQPATEAEVKWLTMMREEEKLARDVYTVLYSTWGLDIFDRIAASEQKHFDAVGTLLVRYGVPDPVQSEAGQFTDPTLQALYNELVASGTTSVANALTVGVTIEEHDISDLEAALAATDKIDIDRVYTNLLRGSLNHLAAFQSHLQVLQSQ